MPLLDHFRNPGKRRLPWRTMGSAWGVALIGWLNRQLPRDEYRAETNIFLGTQVEADVVEWREDDAPGSHRNGAVATAVQVPPAHITLSATFPDHVEIQILEEHGRSLVGVIELVSPSNKKERNERTAFVSKCVAYLKLGVGLVIVDVVTGRRANLHNGLMRALSGSDPQLMADAPNYATGYRPVRRPKSNKNELEIWAFPVHVGETLPVVPFGLKGGPVVMLDLEATYTAAIEATGL